MSQATLTRPTGPNTDLWRPSRRGHGHPWLTLLAVALGVMVVGLDATVVAIANPAIARDLGANFAQLQWVTNGYLLALAVSLIVAGRLADRFGRKTVFLVGVAGFAVASVAVGLSGSIEMVIFWRVVQGFAGALLQPASLAILRNTFPAEKLNMAIGIWAGTSGLAIASGPIVAGLLVENASWEWVFFLNGPVAAVAILLGLWVVRQSRDPNAAGSFDLPGVGLLSAALFSLVWGLIKAQEYGFGDIVPLGFFAGAAVLGTAFIVRERTARHPLMQLSLFRNRSFSAGAVLAMLGFFALFGAFFFLTLYLQQVHGMSPVDAGVRLLPMTATFIVASPVAGALTARFGPRPPLVGGMLLTAVALFALSRMSVQADYLSMWPWFVVIGFGFGFVLVGSTEAIVGNAPVQLAGLAGGIQQTAAQLGGVLGTTVFGTILATRVGDVLLEKLTGAGVPAEMAPGFAAAEDYVAQGVAPVPPGAPQPLADAITTGSHLAFMTGFQTALTVGAAIALIAAFAALLVRRGENTTAGAHAGV
ncbi:MFS transporter [Phytohabitans houttuyneae]|jgi:EmrB/QacA subfamily drug resistance transporter|uniref:MFS transporter n=1 Tax=Phytohabitans houttuyneae TaxID=1076126 RepID=A0A6V8KBR5_9ACTN|nr:MFS transporter [Phytohabitans houttuyneae]